MPADVAPPLARPAFRVDPNAVLLGVDQPRDERVAGRHPAGRWLIGARDSLLSLPAALTHGFKGAFTVAAVLCAIGLALALALLPPRRREGGKEHVEAIALSFARCPGAPYCGHLARVVAFGRRVRGAVARP
jgi:hypothetical protein